MTCRLPFVNQGIDHPLVLDAACHRVEWVSFPSHPVEPTAAEERRQVGDVASLVEVDVVGRLRTRRSLSTRPSLGSGERVVVFYFSDSFCLFQLFYRGRPLLKRGMPRVGF